MNFFRLVLTRTTGNVNWHDHTQLYRVHLPDYCEQLLQPLLRKYITIYISALRSSEDVFPEQLHSGRPYLIITINRQGLHFSIKVPIVYAIHYCIVYRIPTSSTLYKVVICLQKHLNEVKIITSLRLMI
jgi:hypothetical protein